jgi:hypothetical protein
MAKVYVKFDVVIDDKPVTLTGTVGRDYTHDEWVDVEVWDDSTRRQRTYNVKKDRIRSDHKEPNVPLA